MHAHSATISGHMPGAFWSVDISMSHDLRVSSLTAIIIIIIIIITRAMCNINFDSERASKLVLQLFRRFAVEFICNKVLK